MASTDTEGFWSFLDDDSLEIPGVKSTKHPNGKTYKIPSPDAKTGMRLAAVAEIAAKSARKQPISALDTKRLVMDDDEEREFAEQVLGTSLQEFLDDGVSWVHIQRITQFAFTHFAVGADVAREGAAKGAFSGKAPALNRAQRRSKTTQTTPAAPRASSGTKRTSPKAG